MKINYCLPIIQKREEEILHIIEKNRNDYQYFEIWLDYLENLDEQFLKKLLHTFPDQLIFLLRRQQLETITMNQTKRYKILSLVTKKPCLIDLDITQQNELTYLEKHTHTNLLLSYHNYTHTPDELLPIIKQMESFSPKIYKIATFCNDASDALKLLQLQQILKKQNKKHIVLGMGEYGTITRIFGTLWGNELIFAPTATKEASAPGQLTKKQLETIFHKSNL